jgi:hypothetical protein
MNLMERDEFRSILCSDCILFCRPWLQKYLFSLEAVIIEDVADAPEKYGQVASSAHSHHCEPILV